MKYPALFLAAVTVFLVAVPTDGACTKAEWVNVGSNTGLFGYDWQAAGVPGLNLAGGPQGPVKDFAKLKAARGQIADGAYVILPLCPFTSVLAPTYDNRNSSTNSPLLAFDGVPDEKSLVGFRDMLVRVWKEEFSLKDFGEPMPAVLQTNYVRMVRIVREVLDWCHAEGLRPVLVLPPTERSFDGVFPPSFMKAYVYDFIRDVNRRGDTVLDYWNADDLREKRLYANSLFLNRTGRLALTKRTMSDIKTQGKK